ncbi:unnamed protein product [Cuscuta campestris]|uniref:Retrotransposon gag domain-containing protein n=1 Tax=Cuscuta campestris TaxID=132261 RepID=A0A484N4Q1_9ASTE|nr:unnamed protein product [Cuscuta campestris]
MAADSSTPITAACLREFQEQIDDQLSRALQQLHHTVQQVQLDLGSLRAETLTDKPMRDARQPHDHGQVNPMTKLKLDMPKCDGTDPLGWLFKAHEYFVFYAVPEENRLSAVCLMLEGPALDWFRWRQRNHLLDSWADFVTKFKLRFDPLNYVDYLGLLSKVQQSGTVLDYQQAFEKFLVHVTGVDESNLQSLFHAGLKPHLQHEILLQRPASLSMFFALTRELEAKHAAWATSLQSRVPHPGIIDNKPHSTHPIRRLTYAEKKERDAKGLCYNCDEKWVKGHRCGRFLLLLEDDVGDETSPPEDLDSNVVTADISSLHSLAGPLTPRSLRLSGVLSEGVMDVLIDGGSTHNFVQPTVGTTFTVDLYVLPIHGPDVVLGVQWLQLLGKVTLDYAHLTMEFLWKGSRYLLGREFLICTDQRSLKELLQQVIQTPDQQFYVRKLLGYRFRIVYKPGSSNTVADALSRRDQDDIPATATTDFMALSQPLTSIMERIRAENGSQPDLRALHDQYRRGALPAPYVVADGLVSYNTRLCIGADSELREELLREYHDSPIARHAGVHRTFYRLATSFYWPRMRADVRAYIAKCKPLPLPDDLVDGRMPSQLVRLHAVR